MSDTALSDLVRLNHNLIHTVTAFDRKEATKKGYNPYALAIYLGRVSEVVELVRSGTSVARALHDNFNDRLLTVLEKACGLSVTYGGGARDTGRPD